MLLIRTILTVGSYTLMHRLSCVIRDTIQAAVLGTGPLSDAFILAFKLVNILRKLFAEGSFNAAFLPRFSAILNTQGQPAAERMASQVFTWLLIALALILIPGLLFFPTIIRGYAVGFPPGSTRFLYAVELGRICFPYIAASFLVALLSSILNTINRFALPAATQLILNLFLILSMLLGACGLPSVAHMMAWATSCAGIVQVLLLWSVVRYRGGISVGLTRHLWSEETRKVFCKIIPGAVGAGIWPINVMIGTAAASSLQSGTVSCIYYANQVTQFPLGVLGIGLSTALLPPLSRAIQKNDWEQAQNQLNLGILLAVVMTLPATALFLALPEQVTSLLYEHGKFGHAQVCATAPALAMFALGLPAYMLAKVFSTALFSQGNTRHPFLSGLISVGSCAGMIPLFAPFLQQVGIALAVSCAAWANALTLYLFLKRGKRFSVSQETWRACASLVLAGGAMGGVLYVGRTVLLMGASGAEWGVLSLLVLGGLGGFFFWLTGRLFGSFTFMHSLMQEEKKD
ncbi:MAG: murein biosynthesis integral membrane protein MurJ [Holosporales bacterium]|jgi:putative peptidoglycan lipid II flippase|nr:murein biosynthesis integral membrane protein MurJ [Holosporales bacterium]